METAQKTALVRGGEFDGVEVPVRGFFCEFPVPQDRTEAFENYSFPYARDPDGTVYVDGRGRETCPTCGQLKPPA